MARITCTIMALLLLVMSGGAAARMCACLDALAAPSCCEQKMPCCDGGDCEMHPDQLSRQDLALDLFKAVDFVYALPILRVIVVQTKLMQAPVLHVPLVTRVRGPDLHAHALRAPPVQA
jgi:hypothetical protein